MTRRGGPTALADMVMVLAEHGDAAMYARLQSALMSLAAVYAGRACLTVLGALYAGVHYRAGG